MANHFTPIIAQPSGRLFTAADLAVFPTALPSGDIDYELDQGKLIMMVPPGYDRGVLQGLVYAELLLQGHRTGYGQAFCKIGLLLSRNPDSVIGPDAGFIRRSKLPACKSPEGYLETIPDIVVEVRSKNDSQAEMDRKVSLYLAVGIGAVWIVDPEARTIAIHRQGVEPQVYGESDTLALDDPIPGFRLDVAKIFL